MKNLLRNFIQTPRPRRPLHRIMNSMQKEDQQGNIKSQREIEEADHDFVDDSYTDDLQLNKESYSDDLDLNENIDERAESCSPRNAEAPSLRSSPSLRKIIKSSNSPQSVTQSAEKEKFSTQTLDSYSKHLKTRSNGNGDGERKETKLWKYFIITFSFIILLIAAYISMKMFDQSTNNGTQPLLWNDELMKNFAASIDDMSYKFKKQHSNIWDEVYAGVEDIIRHPSKRSVIFMFSNEDDTMFCLAKMLGNATKAVLRSDDNLWLTPSDFDDNYGEVIDKFKKLIEKQKIVIIENILNINPEAMRAFHNFCDSENPLVKQTIYIITMLVKGFKRNEKPHVFVEEQLRRKLDGKINPEKIQPLITRLTDAAIFHVQPEPDFMSCPLRY